VKRSGKWQVVSFQATKIATPSTAEISQPGAPITVPGAKPDTRQAGEATDNSAPSSSALDAVKVDPKHYKIDFENDSVRVVRVQYGPHEKSAIKHEHPGNSIGIYVTDFHASVTFPGGSAREVDGKAGKTFWRAPAVTHISTENLSDQPMEALWVELKPGLGAADSSAEEVLQKAEQDWTKAVVDRDILFLDRILSDDFVGWDYEGKRYTKADSKHDLSSGEWTTTSLRVEDLNVRLYGNMAVVTSRAIRRGEYKDQDNTGQFRWTKVYVKTGKQWQVVAQQSTRIIAP
jgi:ketosteroid isomerase-like protein